jgi:hypothetical protein
MRTISPTASGIVSLLVASVGLLLPLPSRAVGVSSPADVGLADFWVWIEGDNGGFDRLEARGAAPVALDVENPVIGGVAFDGHLIASNERRVTGPATAANAVLTASGTGSILSNVELASLVTFDLAVLSATVPTAAVQIVGEGVGGRAGVMSSGSGSSTSTAFGYVTLYETDAVGNPSTIVQTWEVPSNSTTTPIDGTVMLATNQLYKVIVRSLAYVHLYQGDTTDQYAYMYIDPKPTLLTAEAELIVSDNLPEPAAALMEGTASVVLARLARAAGRRRRS